MSRKLVRLPIEDACIVECPRFPDGRGFLQEFFNAEGYPPQVARFFPVQQNTMSQSHKGVIRGMHCSTYAKLMSCFRGKIYDVIVDLREDSPSYLKWIGVELSADKPHQLLVPPNCGHGFCSLEDNSVTVYCQGGCFNPSVRQEIGFNPLDRIADIAWPVEPKEMILSAKDRDSPALTEVKPVPDAILECRTRILIIGASGQIGGALQEEAKRRCNEFVSYGTYSTVEQHLLMPFDMQKAASDDSQLELLVTLCRPHVLAVCAAFTWVDGNEKFKEKAEQVNFRSVERMAAVCASRDIRLLFYSTDYAFDGLQAPGERYTEEGAVGPLSTYGALKVAAERAVLRASCRNLVLRVSRVYGPEEQGKNFIFQLVDRNRTGGTIDCLADELSNPSYNRDIARATLQLVSKNLSGLFHCAGPETFSKLEWGQRAVESLNLDPKMLKPVHGPQPGLARRPVNGALDSTKLRMALPDFQFTNFSDAMDDWKKNPRGKSIH